MLDRGADKILQKRIRTAANSRRYRRRFNRGQRVLNITAIPDRARTMLIRHGYLPPGDHNVAAIEAALTLPVDDEGHE
jgi:hypothetical protein